MNKKILLILPLLLMSCVTQKKVDNYLKDNPDYLREKCAIQFPSEPKYIKGETIIDTLKIVIEGETIPCPEPSKENDFKPFVKCPDVQYKEVIKTRTDTIYRTNLANEQRLSNLVNEKEQIIKEMTNYKYYFYISLVILVLGIYLYISKK